MSAQLQLLHPDLQLLFMSGYTADIIADHEVLDKGVNFIQKPFSQKDLLTKVSSILGRGQVEQNTFDE